MQATAAGQPLRAVPLVLPPTSGLMIVCFICHFDDFTSNDWQQQLTLLTVTD